MRLVEGIIGAALETVPGVASLLLWGGGDGGYFCLVLPAVEHGVLDRMSVLAGCRLDLLLDLLEHCGLKDWRKLVCHALLFGGGVHFLDGCVPDFIRHVPGVGCRFGVGVE